MKGLGHVGEGARYVVKVVSDLTMLHQAVAQVELMTGYPGLVEGDADRPGRRGGRPTRLNQQTDTISRLTAHTDTGLARTTQVASRHSLRGHLPARIVAGSGLMSLGGCFRWLGRLPAQPAATARRCRPFSRPVG